jgi:hypothetical protein
MRTGTMCLHFSYPDSIPGRTRARRFLRCIPSQVCFEPLTRTSSRLVVVELSPAADARHCQLPSATGKLGRICEKPAPGIRSANASGGHGSAARPAPQPPARGCDSLSSSSEKLKAHSARNTAQEAPSPAVARMDSESESIQVRAPT